MALTITTKIIRSENSEHQAKLNSEGRWEVSWLPGRDFDRDHAITAMAIVDMFGRIPDLCAAHTLWGYIERWSRDLDIPPDEAYALIFGENEE